MTLWRLDFISQCGIREGIRLRLGWEEQTGQPGRKLKEIRSPNSYFRIRDDLTKWMQLNRLLSIEWLRFNDLRSISHSFENVVDAETFGPIIASYRSIWWRCLL